MFARFWCQRCIRSFFKLIPVIVTSNGYYFKGKSFSNSSKLSKIIDALPSIKTIIVKYIQDSSINEIPNSIYWDDFSLSSDTELKFESLRFSHPLYIMLIRNYWCAKEYRSFCWGYSIATFKRINSSHKSYFRRYNFLLYNLWMDDVELAYF